jgi:hypothetical protein
VYRVGLKRAKTEEKTMFIILAGIIGIAIIVAVIAAISTVVSAVSFVAGKQDEDN